MTIRSPRTFASIAIASCLLIGCGGSSSSDETADALQITAVTPTAVDEGATTTVTVRFAYRLATKEAGTVSIGFNTMNEGSYLMSPVDLPVTKGSGTGSLVASVQAVSYPSPGSFRAYANLSERPHGENWVPLASDTRVLPVTPAASASSAASVPLGGKAAWQNPSSMCTAAGCAVPP